MAAPTTVTMHAAPKAAPMAVAITVSRILRRMPRNIWCAAMVKYPCF
jgi:hypothetical protein